MVGTRDLTKGTPWKEIVIFAIPLFISLTFQNLYSVVDSLIAGNMLGDSALAAVSGSSNLIFLFTSFFFGLALGCNALIGKFFGEKNEEMLQKCLHTAVAIGLAGSAILTLIAELLSPVLLKVMGTPENVIDNSIVYFRSYFIGGLGLVMFSMFNSILQAIGNSRRGLYYLIFSSIVNIGLDILFMGPFKMGVFGAGLASAISQTLSALLAYIYLRKKGTIYRIEVKKIRFYKGVTGKMLSLGIPSGIQNSVIAIANVCVQSFINSFGSAAMAGCGSYHKLEGFAFIPINAFTSAISNFISQNLGAKEYERAKKGAKFGIICSLIIAETIGVIIYFACPYLIRIFSSTPEVIEYGVKDAKTLSLFFFLLAYSHCISAVCRGGGKPTIPMLVMLLDWCIIRVVYINVAMNINHDIQLLFWAYPITWAISSIFYLFYYNFSDWVHGFENDDKRRLKKLKKFKATQKDKII